MRISPTAVPQSKLARINDAGSEGGAAEIHGMQTLTPDLCETVASHVIQDRTHLLQLSLVNYAWRVHADQALNMVPPLQDIRHLPIVVQRFPNLRVLDLGGCRQLTDDHLEVGQLTQLRYLNLSNCTRFTSAGLRALLTLQNVVEIHLNDCAQLTDNELAHPKRFYNLEQVHMRGLPRITGTSLAYLYNLPRLRRINFSNCGNVTPAGLSNIAYSQKLERLHLRSCGIYHNAICDNTVELISKLPHLTELDIAKDSSITSIGIAHLGKQLTLTNLNLVGSLLTGH